MQVCAVILAAGEGKRMKSKHAKVVHQAAGLPLISWVKAALDGANAEDQVYIVGHRQEEVRAVLGESVAFVLQEQQLGTGHAVQQASHFLEGRRGATLIMCGDTPLVTAASLRSVLDTFEKDHYAAIVVTAHAPDPTGYGRILRDERGHVQAIVEHRDATPEQREICEVNAGMYCFDTALLLSALGRIGCRNSQQEFYLTDTIEILRQDGHKIGASSLPFEEVLGVNDRRQLQESMAILNRRILEKHMIDGVTIVDPATTWIEQGVTIGTDTTILPNCSIKGSTEIGSDAVIGPDTHLVDMKVADGVRLDHVTAVESEIGARAYIGPYSHIRPGSKIGPNCRLGNFVEIKNSTLGADCYLIHQCYIGDTDVGHNVNIGSSASTANYDGVNKSRSAIGSHAFIGSNSCLVSPVSVDENAYVAAGSTITEGVNEYALAIARAHQINKEDWVKTRGLNRNQRLNP
ncbi:MAG: bifunctional UDP-N-acetylglucosamine diphosphorylase/glucosamine-1-phosphate N-acetyltransferase GlmU [Eubacteriales bacterium]|nr:bifunctional UDP-N-acetylglucosamine diphosphorylase/glucosamine-1-phosphate N-acetyltransferase GlmU [Eubacteriales bacterium]